MGERWEVGFQVELSEMVSQFGGEAGLANHGRKEAAAIQMPSDAFQ